MAIEKSSSGATPELKTLGDQLTRQMESIVGLFERMDSVDNHTRAVLKQLGYIGEDLAEVARNQGWDIETIAQASGVREGAVRALLVDNQLPFPEDLGKIAKALNRSVVVEFMSFDRQHSTSASLCGDAPDYDRLAACVKRLSTTIRSDRQVASVSWDSDHDLVGGVPESFYPVVRTASMLLHHVELRVRNREIS